MSLNYSNLLIIQGSGKGTQCSNIVNEYGFTHLSAGDLLREERKRPGSQYGALIEDYITNGKIVPVEITCSLLENAMIKTKQVTKEKRHLTLNYFIYNIYGNLMTQHKKSLRVKIKSENSILGNGK